MRAIEGDFVSDRIRITKEDLERVGERLTLPPQAPASDSGPDAPLRITLGEANQTTPPTTPARSRNRRRTVVIIILTTVLVITAAAALWLSGVRDTDGRAVSPSSHDHDQAATRGVVLPTTEPARSETFHSHLSIELV